jgi:hypothetical protein
MNFFGEALFREARIMTPISHGVRLSVLIVGVGCILAPLPRAFGAPPSQECGQLVSLQIPATTIVSAQPIEAGTFKLPQGDPLPNLKAFCRVSAVVKPSSDSDIRFEVWLPASEWNGRLWAAGTGGFAGSIPYWSLGPKLAEAYATVGTDTGHQGTLFDSAWAVGHPEKVVDYGYRAIHEVTVRAKLIVAAFYGRKPTHSYFSGCSNGGRQGLMEAQRYPDDYDGIIADAPANEGTHLLAEYAWTQFIWLAQGPGHISASKVPAIQSAVLAACDGLDGVKDGVIEDPQHCSFDPQTLQCQGAETDSCLTQDQIGTLRKIRAGVVLADGTRLFPGYPPGAEAHWGEWNTASVPEQRGAFRFANGHFRDFVFEDPKWDFHRFNPERDVQAADQKLAFVFNATDPDLTKFVARGGKLILYHGWNDGAIPALSTVDYYLRVLHRMGEKATGESIRLFMVPGMEHCGGGPGPNSFGQLAGGTGDPENKVGAALQRWVEQGIAPERIIATKRKNDEDPTSEVIRTRPLCAYPNVAHYRGKGSTDSAVNFDCAAAP